MMNPRRKIEGLLFDLGGVVIDIDFDQALRIWSRHSALSVHEMRSRFSLDAAYESHERGETGQSAYFGHLRDLFELDATDPEIALGWNAIFVGEIAETVNYILKARDQLPCFAFSNSNPTHQAAWMAAYPRAVSSFQQIYVSSELGLRKPEQAAFKAVVDATQINPAALLFFDDTAENVAGARAAGLQAIHVKTPSDVQQALAEIGVL